MKRQPLHVQEEAKTLWRSLHWRSLAGVIAGLLALVLPVPGLVRRAIAVVAVAAGNASLLIVVSIFELPGSPVAVLPAGFPAIAISRAIVQVTAVSEFVAILCAQEISSIITSLGFKINFMFRFGLFWTLAKVYVLMFSFGLLLKLMFFQSIPESLSLDPTIYKIIY